MARFIARRLLQLIPICLGVSLLSFFIISATPGDFLTAMSLNPAVSPERISHLRHDFGLDRPWYVQYARWLYRLSPIAFPPGLKWPDLGYSFAHHTPTIDLIGGRLANTLLLAVCAQLIAWSIAVPAGVLSGMKKDSPVERLSSSAVFVAISTPQIILALLALLLAAKTGWFPIGGMRSVDSDSLTQLGKLIDLLHHLALPVIVLSISEAAVLTRYMRSSFVENMAADYVRTARAKGLTESAVAVKHVLPNALNPMITLLGISFGNMISASFLVEVIMGWPGLGRLAYDAMLARDLHVIMASLLLGTVFLVIGNLIGDILLAFSDPRIRHES